MNIGIRRAYQPAATKGTPHFRSGRSAAGVVTDPLEDVVAGRARPIWRASGLDRRYVRRLEHEVGRLAPGAPGVDENEVLFPHRINGVPACR